MNKLSDFEIAQEALEGCLRACEDFGIDDAQYEDLRKRWQDDRPLLRLDRPEWTKRRFKCKGGSYIRRIGKFDIHCFQCSAIEIRVLICSIAWPIRTVSELDRMLDLLVSLSTQITENA